MAYLSTFSCHYPRRLVPRNYARVCAGSEEEKPVAKKVAAGSGFGASSKLSSSKQASSKNVGQSTSSMPSIVRRPAPGKAFLEPQSNPKAQNFETIFVYGLFAFLVIILVEGLALAASGFLPEEWDKFFVDVVYPSFTPTVGLFLAFASSYGLLKFLGNESQNKS